MRGARLLQAQAVARFFEARAFAPAWRLPAGAQQVVTAIRNIDQDGLTPADYHLAAITAALDAYGKTPSTDVAADLQVLVADAAAALVDHVRYGRVRPASLDKRWNVDPRVGTPALDVALVELARAPALDAGIEAQKPAHFIYVGLKQALARMRTVVNAGGWPAVTPGPAIKPGATDPRVALVRKRLLVTGELAAADRERRHRLRRRSRDRGQDLSGAPSADRRWGHREGDGRGDEHHRRDAGAAAAGESRARALGRREASAA